MTDLTVANTILAQLGGNKFRAMTGSKNFVGGENTLSFRIGRNAKSINAVRITLTAGDDYTVEFLRIRKTEVKVSTKVEGVYFDRLQAVFTENTGMDTHL